MMDTRLIQLRLVISDRALEVETANDQRLAAKSALTLAYREYKRRNGIREDFARESVQWVQMELATGKEYQAVLNTRRKLANARKRLTNAVRKCRLAEGTP